MRLASFGSNDSLLAQAVDLRKNKRYRLRAPVTFFWDGPDGYTIRGQGYTRDLSSSGVFVLTSDQLPSAAVVTLEITLPSPRPKHSGACLRTVASIVRSEDAGFAAVADTGFRMQFPEPPDQSSFGTIGGDGNDTHEARGKQLKINRLGLIPHFSV